jgi:hypothetical protein
MNEQTAPATFPALTRMAELTARLTRDPRLEAHVVTRPHPLLTALHKDDLFVLVAPASVWTRGRALLRPFAAHLAQGEALLILLGRPDEPDLAQALNRGLAAIVPTEPEADELYVGILRAFELLEQKARAESRGKWLNRYRYELGELIEIAKAITTEREIDKLLGLILEKSRFITGADAGSIYVVEGDDPDPLRRSPALQALAERLGGLRLARVHRADEHPLDVGLRRAHRGSLNIPTTSTICPRTRPTASIAPSTPSSATAPNR